MSNILKNSLVVSVLGLGGAFLNFASQIITAGFFGAGAERDAFFAAAVIPTYINTVVLGSIGIAFVPSLMDAKVNRRGNEATLVGGVMGWIFVVLLILSTSLAVFARPVVSIFFPGFDAEVGDTTARILIILCPAILFQSYTSVLTCVYHAEGKFVIPAIVNLIPPVSNAIFVLTLHSQLGISALAIGTSIGFTLAFLVVQSRVPVKYKMQPFLFLRNDVVSQCLRSALPWLLGGFIYRGSTVVERMVASQFPKGVISYLGYVGALITTLSLITMNGIGTTIFPKLAEAWAVHDQERLRTLFAGSLKFTFALCVPIIVSILAFSNTIVRLLFERGAFTPSDTEQVGGLLVVCTGTFLFICINTIPGKLLAASGFSRFVVTCSVIEMGIYIALAFYLSRLFSYWGIAYAQIISTMFSVICSSVVLHLRFRIYNSPGLVRDLLVISLSGFVCYGVMMSHQLFPGISSALKDSSLLVAILFGGLGLALYLLLIAKSIKEAKLIVAAIVDKVRNTVGR